MTIARRESDGVDVEIGDPVATRAPFVLQLRGQRPRGAERAAPVRTDPQVQDLRVASPKSRSHFARPEALHQTRGAPDARRRRVDKRNADARW
ncbi:MAG TPA: hypothetical protein VFT22_22370 [Kofleriaceae bacterium]|nr:hypothetical protein [Kofleriaceae bacterium]